MTIADLSTWIGLGITLISLLYVLAKFKAEFELHKKILNELIVKVEAINTDFTFVKGYLFGKQS